MRGVIGDLAALKPRVTDLQVSADGELVSVPSSSRVLAESSLVELPRAARAVVLRYRVQNASSRSLPGPPGRALVLLPPISTMPPGASLPVVVEVRGGTVLNLLCPGLDRGHQLCGHDSGAAWYSDQLPAGRTAVVAQVDLPPPGA